MKEWAVVFTALLLFSCAGTKNMRDLNLDFDRLQSQINLLQMESESTKNEVSDIRAKNLELKIDLSLPLDNLESEIRTLSTCFEEYKVFLQRTSEEINRIEEEMSGRLGLEERRGTQEQRFTEIEDWVRTLDGKADQELIRINSWSNQ